MNRRTSDPLPAILTTVSVLLIAGVIFIAAGVGYFYSGRTQSAPPAKSIPTVLYRDAFRKMVVGKSPPEVRTAVGTPHRTRDGIGDATVWIYHDRTRDPITGKIDSHAIVIFEDGVAQSVSY